jgi:hypothetical protein
VCHEAREIWELPMCFSYFLWKESDGAWGFAGFSGVVKEPRENTERVIDCLARLRKKSVWEL